MVEPVAEARCRLCTANDLDGLIEDLAAELWESRRHGTLDDHPWAKAGPMWQRTFRDFAHTAIDVLRERHVATAGPLGMTATD